VTRIDEIEARKNAATAGPLELVEIDGAGLVSIRGPSGPFIEGGHWDGSTEISAENLAFILHAREDVDWLIARVRELEAATKEACDRNHVRGQREMRDRIVDRLYQGGRVWRSLSAALREFPVEAP
jgi:hypothetical protein